MKETRIVLLATAAILILIFTGCATTTPPESVINKPERAVRVFVETFEDAPDSPGSGSIFTPIFVTALTRVGETVNARYIRTTKKESAEAVITGQVTLWNDGSWTTQPQVGFEARCVHAESGDILWTVADAGRPFAAALENRTAQIASRKVAEHGLKMIRNQL